MNRSDSLRAIADMIDKNPEMDMDSALNYQLKNLAIYIYNDEAQEIAKWMRAGKAAGATVTKEYDTDFFRASLAFGDVIINVNTARDAVCTPTVKGKKSVTRRVPTEPIVYVDKVVEEDIIEWECHPILSDKDA